MAHKIMINVGHGLDSAKRWDCGCTYNGLNEAALMMPITVAAVKYCRTSGITVLSDSDSGNNHNVITGTAWANKEKVELFISIHCDWYKAQNGVYPLFYPTSAKGKKLATCLESAIKNGMKMPSRGIKGRSDLYELSETDMCACILETSSVRDSVLRNKPDEYGKCIAKGICAYLGVTFKDGTEKETIIPETAADVNYLVKVPADKCVIRKGAGSNHAKVRTCPKGVYTIVKQFVGWGLLKSGEGWIYLAYTTKYEPVKKTKIQKFCDELYRLAPIIEKQLSYSNDDGNCHTWEDALKYKKCNCAKYISYALQNVGLIPKGLTFYWYHSKTLKPAKAKEHFLNSKDWKVTYPNRVMKASELKVGDIVGWHSSSSQHTCAIVGKDANGNFIWASGGSSDMKNGMIKRRDNFTNHVINCHIRYVGEE